MFGEGMFSLLGRKSCVSSSTYFIVATSTMKPAQAAKRSYWGVKSPDEVDPAEKLTQVKDEEVSPVESPHLAGDPEPDAVV